MSAPALHIAIKAITDQYKKFLDTISETEFQETPPDGGWSYSEVYSHVFQSNLGCLIAIEKCILGTGTKTKVRIHWMAWLVLFLETFPPGKLKAPEKLAAMVKKITKEEARNLIVKFNQRLDDIVPRLNRAAVNCKVKHARLGLLNAPQWLKFVKVHSRHHIRQLDRIKVQLVS